MPITKSDLLIRIERRARDRYGQEIGMSWLNDFIKDGLIPAATGRSPNYKYDCRAYRRALQLVRLRRAGIVERSALKVQLFLRGYSLPVWDVREALRSQYVKYSRSLLAQIRSTYAGKHKISLIRQFGSLDERLGNSGLGFPSIRISKGFGSPSKTQLNLAS